VFFGGGALMKKKKKVLANFIVEDGLYRLANVDHKSFLSTTSGEDELVPDTKRLQHDLDLHKKYGHPSHKVLKHIKGFKNSKFVCETCQRGKTTQTGFKKRVEYAMRILERIHSDLMGPFRRSVTTDRYIVSFIDEKSSFARVVVCRCKSEFKNLFLHYKSEYELQTGLQILKLGTNGAGEFWSHSLNKLIKEAGIIQEEIPSYVHQKNGLVERFQRSLAMKIRCLLIESGLGAAAWPVAVGHAARNPSV
jgi:hypothetical protein